MLNSKKFGLVPLLAAACASVPTLSHEQTLLQERLRTADAITKVAFFLNGENGEECQRELDFQLQFKPLENDDMSCVPGYETAEDSTGGWKNVTKAERCTVQSSDGIQRIVDTTKDTSGNIQRAVFRPHDIPPIAEVPVTFLECNRNVREHPSERGPVRCTLKILSGMDPYGRITYRVIGEGNNTKYIDAGCGEKRKIEEFLGDLSKPFNVFPAGYSPLQ